MKTSNWIVSLNGLIYKQKRQKNTENWNFLPTVLTGFPVAVVVTGFVPNGGVVLTVCAGLIPMLFITCSTAVRIFLDWSAVSKLQTEFEQNNLALYAQIPKNQFKPHIFKSCSWHRNLNRKSCLSFSSLSIWRSCPMDQKFRLPSTHYLPPTASTGLKQ